MIVVHCPQCGHGQTSHNEDSDPSPGWCVTCRAYCLKREEIAECIDAGDTWYARRTK